MKEMRQPLLEHLKELRRRLIRSLLGLVVGVGISLIFAKEIFVFLQQPLLKALAEGSHFITTNPLEAWVTYLKVSLLAGVFLSSPWLLYQTWRFVAPALYQKEKRGAFLFVSLSTLFFVGGAGFGYFVIFPIGFKFFTAVLAGTEILLLPQMRDYLGFIAKMLLTFGIIFEIPLILTLLARLGIVSYHQLKKARRYVLVLTFLIAGILTPGPDVLSQLLMALPLLGLYEFSLIVIWFMKKPPHSS